MNHKGARTQSRPERECIETRLKLHGLNGSRWEAIFTVRPDAVSLFFFVPLCLCGAPVRSDDRA
jgi:hypothetical protein